MWPVVAIVCLPLLLSAVAGAMLIKEQLEPDTQKAIRLVRESNSRKENFTVQQYLYSTVFHRRRLGENVEIEGWRACPSKDQPTSIVVEFSYTDGLGPHLARWDSNLAAGRAAPLNDAARDLSWH